MPASTSARRSLPIAFALMTAAVVTPVLGSTDKVTITPDVVYGHKMGMALTLDIVQPEKPNGAATLFMMSGGWVSSWFPVEQLLASGIAKQGGFHQLLDKGFTLVVVRHGSSPKFLVPDAVADVRMAVRHVKMRANDYQIDPNRLGVFGGSAGGHLSLMLGTTADDGDPTSQNLIERINSRVAAVVAYFPPTDLEPYLTGDFRKRFPALKFDAKESDSVSPINHVSSDDAPTLLLHGGKDKLVPVKHSQDIRIAFDSANVRCQMIVFQDSAHGFSGDDLEHAAIATVSWFERHLAATE